MENPSFAVIPAKAGIQLYNQLLLDSVSPFHSARNDKWESGKALNQYLLWNHYYCYPNFFHNRVRSQICAV